MKIMCVAGDFGDNPKSSSYMGKLVKEMSGHFNQVITMLNGGKFSDLETAVEAVSGADVVFWFANVDNSRPKLVKEIKKRNNKIILVTSKLNSNSTYQFQDLIARSLDTKSNLFLEIKKIDECISCSVMDPLGNCFCDSSPEIAEVAKILVGRVLQLYYFHRVGSVSLGPDNTCSDDIIALSESKREFFDIVRACATVFTEFIIGNGVDHPRYLGNASFRCGSGFPSMRVGESVYVSRRNLDKSDIGIEGMVRCESELFIRAGETEPVVSYFGEHKPSVDSPVQIILYQRLPKAHYMMHQHAYIKGALFTESVIPCGAIEEVNEIMALAPRSGYNFSVNLLGHGSIAIANDIEYFNDISFFPRKKPEHRLS